MKKIWSYLLLITLSIMFYSCDTADPIKYYSVHGTLYYYTPPGYYAHPKDIPVVLDSDTLLSDLNGEYIFNNVSEGYHLISVSIAEYEPYTDSFLVSRNEMKNIELKGVKEDYFPPIQLNSVKKFKYTDSNCRSSPYIYIEGEAVWNFYNKKEEGGILTYSGEEAIIYTRTEGGQNPTTDTIVVPLEIIEENHIIKIISSYCWNGISFDRYFDHLWGEIIFQDINSTTVISLKKNVGLYKLVKVPVACASTKYELIE